ncbi:MAG TPA: M67 family metallopeptidase [Solirubrobacteraceae bacterium]|jgi:proteasome lid subunit RPN8/RPN11|nr:M67 family metallopeptidase [Solirubrobacteraceae bacterium]
MRIAPALREELIAHALEDPGNEVCGVIAVATAEPESGGGAGAGDASARAVRVLRANNRYASPLRFEIEPKELLELSNTCEELGELGAIYHSHVRSAPYPSQTDINFAANWPGVEWLIVGLAADADPELRSYLIENGQVREVALEVT